VSEQDLTRARTELSKDPEELETWADVLGICAEKLMYACILAASGDESDQRRVARALAQASGALTATQLRVIELEGQISRMLGEEQEAVARTLLDRIWTAMDLADDPPTVDQTVAIIRGYVRQAGRDWMLDEPRPVPPVLREGDGTTVRLTIADGTTRELPGRVVHHVSGLPIIEADYS
jgi:hypothetical protein